MRIQFRALDSVLYVRRLVMYLYNLYYKLYRIFFLFLSHSLSKKNQIAWFRFAKCIQRISILIINLFQGIFLPDCKIEIFQPNYSKYECLLLVRFEEYPVTGWRQRLTDGLTFSEYRNSLQMLLFLFTQIFIADIFTEIICLKGQNKTSHPF